MSELTKKQIINYKIDTARLIRGSKQSMYISEVIAIPTIMQTRWSQPKTKKSDLGFNKINLRTISRNTTIKNIFCRKNKATAQNIRKWKNKNWYVFFCAQICCRNRKGHIDRNQNKENERQTEIEKHPDCKFFHRINPVVEGCDIFLEICKIQNYITQSNKEKLKKIAKELLKYISNISKPLKHIRHFVEKILPTL